MPKRVDAPMRAAKASDRVLLTCRAYGLPVPCVEWRFHPPRRWKADYAWPAKMVLLECEGGIWSGGRHTRGKGFLADLEKYNRAALEGWTLLRCTPQQIQSGEIVGMLREALT